MCQIAKDGKALPKSMMTGADSPAFFNWEDIGSSEPKENSNSFLSCNFFKDIFHRRRTK